MGVACHITAASEGGPRYDPSLTPAQRSAGENGIWLCQTHAKFIDNDPARFTVDTLRAWKQVAEDMTDEELGAIGGPSRDLLATSGRLTAVLVDTTEHFDRLSAAGATEPLTPAFAEAARQLEYRIASLVGDVLALNANPLFDAADRQETAIAVKAMQAALRLRGFQYQYAYANYDEDVFRGYFEARQNEYHLGFVEQARSEFVSAFDLFERRTGLWARRIRSV